MNLTQDQAHLLCYQILETHEANKPLTSYFEAQFIDNTDSQREFSKSFYTDIVPTDVEKWGRQIYFSTIKGFICQLWQTGARGEFLVLRVYSSEDEFRLILEITLEDEDC